MPKAPLLIVLLAGVSALLSCSPSPPPSTDPATPPATGRKPPLLPGNELESDTRAILEKGERFILLSLDPAEIPPDMPAPMDVFHRFPVLKRIEIVDPAERKQLLESLDQSVAEFNTQPHPCFFARHGITATHGDQQADLVICFECRLIRVYHKGRYELGTTTRADAVLSKAIEKMRP